MTAIEEELDAFLAREIEKPFAWGVTDCAATADRWATITLGWSPLRRYGRMHLGEADARKWLAQPGGIAVAMNRVMRSCGIPKTTQPDIGDVGLVVHGSQASEIKLGIAIKTKKLWCGRHESGLFGTPHDACWKAWKVT